MKNIYKYLVLFFIGGFLYIICELIYKQHSHWTMFCLGGCCFLICDMWNNIFSWKTSLLLQMLLSAISITILEFLVGYLVNIKLGWNVWNYTKFDFMGQISLIFFFVWYVLSGIGIILSDVIRWKFFGEENPHYVIF
jgi:hypothetical protein